MSEDQDQQPPEDQVDARTIKEHLVELESLVKEIIELLERINGNVYDVAANTDRL